MKKLDYRLTADIFLTFARIGALSFGGGYSMIPLIEIEIADNKKWLSHEKLTDIFTIGGILPGAIALNTSAFVGFEIVGFRGAIIALCGNITPSVFIMLLFTMIFSTIENNIYIEKIFNGLRPAIVGLIAFAAFRIAKTAFKDKTSIILGAVAFLLLALNIAPIPVILGGGLAGYIIITIKNLIKAHKLKIDMSKTNAPIINSKRKIDDD